MKLKPLLTSSLALMACENIPASQTIERISDLLQGQVERGGTRICQFQDRLYPLSAISAITLNTTERVVAITIEPNSDVPEVWFYRITDGVLTQSRFEAFGPFSRIVEHDIADPRLHSLEGKVERVMLAAETECVD